MTKKFVKVAHKECIFFGGDMIGDLADHIASMSIETAHDIFFKDEDEWLDHYPKDEPTTYKVTVTVEKVVDE